MFKKFLKNKFFFFLTATALITSCRNLYYKGYHMYDHNLVDRKAQEWEVGSAFEKYEYVNSGKFMRKKVFIHQGKNVWEYADIKVEVKKNVWEYADIKVEVKKNKLSGNFVPVDSSEYQKYLYYVGKEFENNQIKNRSEERYAANQTHITIFDSIIFHKDTTNIILFSDVADIKDYRHFLGKERGDRMALAIIPIAGGVTMFLILFSFFL